MQGFFKVTSKFEAAYPAHAEGWCPSGISHAIGVCVQIAYVYSVCVCCVCAKLSSISSEPGKGALLKG